MFFFVTNKIETSGGHFLLVFTVIGVDNKDGVVLHLFSVVALSVKAGLTDGHEDVVMVGQAVDHLLGDLLLLQHLLLRLAHLLSHDLHQVPFNNLKIEWILRIN